MTWGFLADTDVWVDVVCGLPRWRVWPRHAFGAFTMAPPQASGVAGGGGTQRMLTGVG